MRFIDISPGDHARVIGRVSLVFALFTASLFLPATRAESTPREFPVTTVSGNIYRFQPPSFRLYGMGDLNLVVRDEYTEINLWDFAGVTAGAGIDRDSTSLEMWLSGRREVTTVDDGELERETFRTQGGAFGTEGVIRFSPTLSLGVDAGVLSLTDAEPYSDGVNTSLGLTLPAANIFGSGRLVGPVLWGLSAFFASESYNLKFWEDKVDGDVVKIGQRGNKIDPSNFFLTDQGDVDIKGVGGSLAYWNPNLGSAAFYLNGRSEDVLLKVNGPRHLYDTFEPRDVTTYGFAFIFDPGKWGEAGIDVGREDFGSLQEYRFTLSGGTTGLPFTSRGNRLERNRRRDFFRFRAMADVPTTKLTVGAQAEVLYDHMQITPVAQTDRDFNNFVVNEVTVDTLIAPRLVRDQLQEHRVLVFGGGGSYKLRDDTVLLGAQFRWHRDAISGLDLLARPQGWELDLGGEWEVAPKWTVRTGYQLFKIDRDKLTPLNELDRYRWTLGGQWRPGSGWRVDGFAWLEWVRTGFEDPLGEAGSGTRLGFLGTKEF